MIYFLLVWIAFLTVYTMMLTIAFNNFQNLVAEHWRKENEEMKKDTEEILMSIPTEVKH